MPFKSEKFRKISKYCLWCHKLLKLNNNRDIERKKFCSFSHRQLWRYKHEKWDMKEVSKCGNTPEANAKKILIGSKNGRWIEDRSQVKFRPRHEMTFWKKAIYQRDDYICQICGKRGGKLQVDHIKPYSLYPNLRWKIENGRTLCIDCHKQTDTYGWKMVNFMKGNSYAVC